MGTGWLSHVGEWVSAWPSGLWRASWQGALCAALVFALTRAWPRMPASLRAGLWWLVALKFVVSLGWLKPVPLPLLPAPEARPEASRLSRYIKEGTEPGGEHRGSVHLPSVERGPQGVPVALGGPVGLVDGAGERAGAGGHGEALGAPGGIARGVSARSPAVALGESVRASGEAVQATGAAVTSSGALRLAEVAASSAAALRPWWRVLVLGLLAAWAAGVLWQVVGHVKGWASVRRVRRSARPLEHPALQEELRELSRAAGLWRVPGLLVSDSVASPLATGVLSPVVVLPAKAVRRLPAEALRMALAHELAHLRRGDLWLGWVPALAEALLFFHPLARRAAREYALAREEACDAEALRLTGAEPADYGELLLAFGVARTPGTAAALGASAHIQALHRRLSMLEHFEAVPARPRRLLKVALSALGLAALVPFQVVAQEAASKPAAPQGTAATAAPAKPAATATPERREKSLSAPTAASTPSAPGSASAPSASSAGSAPAASSAPGAASAPTTGVAATPSAPGAASAPAASSAPRVASAPAAVATPRVASVPAAPPAPRVGAVPPAPPRRVDAAPPVPPAPRVASVPPMPHVPHIGVVPPVPPVPPIASAHGDDDAYVLLSDGMATMSGSMVDLNLARMFNQKNAELLYVRRNGEAFLIRDPATLKAVREALAPTREMGKAQGELGEKQGALGEQQGKLGEKQGELGMKQGELGLKQAELAHKRAGLHLEERRLDRLPEAEQDKRRAELEKLEKALEAEEQAIDKQMDALGEQMEALGREQEKLGEQQEKLGEQQEKLSEQHEARIREAEKKVDSLIDEALKKGLGQPLPS